MRKLIIFSLVSLFGSFCLFSNTVGLKKGNQEGITVQNSTAIGNINTGIPNSGSLVSTIDNPDYNSSSLMTLCSSADYLKSPYPPLSQKLKLSNPLWYFLGLCSYSSGKQVWSMIPLQVDYDPSTIENDLASISTHVKWQNGLPILWYIGGWNDGLNTGTALYYYNQVRDQQVYEMNIQNYSFHKGDIVDIDSTPDFDAMLMSDSTNNCAVTYFDGKNCHPYKNMPTIGSNVTPIYISGKFRNSNTSTVMYTPSIVYVLSDGSIYYYVGSGSFLSSWIDLNSSTLVGNKTFPKGSISNVSVNWAMVPAPQSLSTTVYPQIMIAMNNGSIYYFDGDVADGWASIYSPLTAFLNGYKYLNVNWNADNVSPSLFAVSSDSDKKGFFYFNVANNDSFNDTTSNSNGIFDVAWNDLGAYPNYLQLNNNSLTEFTNYAWTSITDNAYPSVDSMVSVDFTQSSTNNEIKNNASNFLAITAIKGNSILKFSQNNNSEFSWNSISPFPANSTIMTSSFISNAANGAQGLVVLNSGDIYYTPGAGIWSKICSVSDQLSGLTDIRMSLSVISWPSMSYNKLTSSFDQPCFVLYLDGVYSGSKSSECAFYNPLEGTFSMIAPSSTQTFDQISASYVGVTPLIIAINDTLDYIYKSSGLNLESISTEPVFSEGISSHSISWDANGDPYIVLASNDSVSTFKSYDGTGGCVSSNFNTIPQPTSNCWTSQAVKISSFWSGTAIYFIAGFSDGSLYAYNGNSSTWYKLPSQLSDSITNIVVNWPNVGSPVTWNEYPSLIASDDKNIFYMQGDGGNSLKVTTSDLSSFPNKIYASFHKNDYPTIVASLSNGQIISFN